MSIQVAYNNLSDTYDDDHNLTRDLDQKVSEKILVDSRYKLVIELGCGTGKNTLLLSKIADQVYATDFSVDMVEKAKKKVDSANVTFSIQDITKQWIYDDESADLITCNLILEHIKNLSHIFLEANRTLINGGYLFISELHPFRQYKGAKATFQENHSLVEIPSFLHHASDFFNIGKNYGFVLEDFREWWDEQDQNKLPRLVSFLFRK